MNWKYRDPTKLTEDETLKFQRDPITWMSAEIQEARSHDPLVGTVAQVIEPHGYNPHGLGFYVILAFYALRNCQSLQEELLKMARGG